MIKFYVDKKGISIDANSIKEFQENVMTTKEIVDRIKQFYQKSEHIFSNETAKMLTSFFNDPSRRFLSTTEAAFDTLNYGYGIADNELHKIIMWQDESGLHNFAMYVKNTGSLGGKIIKIWVEPDDIFCKNQMEAALYLAELKKKESKNDSKSDNTEDCYFYKVKLTEFDDKLEDIEKQMKCCKDEMTEISKRYIELCCILYNLKKDKIKVNKDKTLFIYKNKNI